MSLKKGNNKKILWGVLVLIAIALGGYFFFATQKFADTKETKADHTSTAAALITEFEKDAEESNKKYTDKIIAVSGRVTELESPSDTTINIKMSDSISGSYIIFAFQQQYINEAKTVKPGDSISIKGACSGGNFSDILESTSIEFKRCTLIK